MPDSLRHEPEASRYVLDRDGDDIGLTNYRVVDDAIQITHTEVRPSLRGQGLGGLMVRAVLDDIRERTGSRVVAICPFVEDWIDLHPDYQDLLTR
jgi:predicted GNAT family acetyltransferase